MKIKVLYVISDREFGGGSRHLLELINGLDKKKFEPVLISIPSPILDRCKNNIKCYSVEIKSRFDLSAIKKIKNIIIDIKPDIVHLHSTRAGILGTIAARNMNIPIIYTEHLFTHEYVPHNKLIHLYQIFAFKNLSKNISSVIAVSKAVRKYLVDKKIFPANKVKVIHNGIQTQADSYQPSAKSQKPKTDIVIGSIGTLSPIKGYKYLIEAFNDLCSNLELKDYDIRLEIIGTGPDKKTLQDLINKYNLQDKITFLGQKDNVYKEIAEWDIYIQPSLSETFGLALGEAMSTGLPVIASNVGGMKELVDEKSAILVEPKNSGQISDALLKLVNNPSLRKTLGKNGKERINKYFSAEIMISKTEKMYEKLSKKSA